MYQVCVFIKGIPVFLCAMMGETNSGDIFSGFLLKKGQHGKAKGALRNSWKRRFFQLQGKNCYYYESNRTEASGQTVGVELKGAITISGWREDGSRPRCLELQGIPKRLLVQAEDDVRPHPPPHARCCGLAAAQLMPGAPARRRLRCAPGRTRSTTT